MSAALLEGFSGGGGGDHRHAHVPSDHAQAPVANDHVHAASVEPDAPQDSSSYDPRYSSMHYGMEGGGPPSPQALALLDNDNIKFDADGVADLKAGRIDPRMVSLLDRISEKHKIVISAMCSDHPKLTTGGSVSNHWLGRGLDIAMVDGRPVNPGNGAARELAQELSKMDSRIRPSEIGSPWQLAGPAYFSDAAHQNHVHVGLRRRARPVVASAWRWRRLRRRRRE